MHQKKFFFTIILGFLISSCGGGGGGTSEQAPQINSETPSPAPASSSAPNTSSISSNLIAQATGTIQGKISYEEIDRQFILYVPTSYNSSSKQPLIFNFHGYGSNANEQMRYGDFRSQADAYGFILVHPEGLDDVGGTSYWNMGGWSVSVHDDVKFIDNLINLLMDKYSINAERIYSTGMSNGGFFSFHLACNLNASFAAIASVTGSMSFDTFNDCNPRKPTPVLQIHGSIDRVVPYDGLLSIMKPVMDVMDYWKASNDCDEFVHSVPIVIPGELSWTETYIFDNCLNNTQNIHLKVQGVGHIWPGSIFERIQEPDTSEYIWEFFSKYDINGVIQ